MATATTESASRTDAGNIGRVLGELRRRISRYVVLEGLALVVIAAGLLFWLMLGLDSAWFRFRRLELPGWFRLAAVVLGVGVLVLVFVRHVFLRMVRSYQPTDLALVLERRFPELNDGLITAVEMSGNQPSEGDAMTSAMLVRTVDRVSDNVAKLPMEAVFAMKPLRVALVGAAVLVLSIVSLAAVRTDVVERWWNAFVLNADSYWVRESRLRVYAIVQPGDRVREFRPADVPKGPGYWTTGCLELLHPRNTDLTIVIESDDTSGQEWKVPDRVRLDLTRATDEKRVYLSPVDGGRFRYSMDRLNDNIEFNIQGGDFANRLPFRIRVVDPPRIDGVLLRCDYPGYTGWNESHPREVTVTGTQAELPVETRFELVARTNKKLAGLHLEAGDAELTLRDGEAVLRTTDADGGAQTRTLSRAMASAVIDESRTEIRLPLVMTSDSGRTPDDRIVVQPDSLLRFYLHDEDDIVSAEPIVLRILGKPDEPPAADCEREGVGEAITRKASIPIRGLVTDDYGIANARFEFKVDDEENWRPRRFRNRVAGLPLDYTLQGRDDEAVERFNVSVLGLEEGQKLTLSVYAEDADNIHGPNAGRSQKFEFRIVSNEELLSLLYSREINLRRRFEEVIRQVEGVREDLSKHRTRLGDLAGADANGAAAIRTSVEACAARTLNTIRKNGNESRSVEAAFSDIVEELINNAIPPQSLAEEMRRAIVRPLHAINETDFPGVDTALGSFKLAVERDNVTTEHIDSAVTAVDEMLTHMRVLLDEIKDLAELHEIVNDLKQLIDAQSDLRDKTKGLQKKRLIEKLKLLGGDDDQ